MILEKGNMWSIFDATDAFVITTNPIQRKDGAVVMGRGIALEAKTRFPTLPFDFGKQLQYQKANGFSFPVGKIGKYENTDIYWFMVKNHWAEKADLQLIKSSCFFLLDAFARGEKRVDINFPGIGNGKLQRESVLEIITAFPDNFHVWEYE